MQISDGVCMKDIISTFIKLGDIFEYTEGLGTIESSRQLDSIYCVAKILLERDNIGLDALKEAIKQPNYIKQFGDSLDNMVLLIKYMDWKEKTNKSRKQ